MGDYYVRGHEVIPRITQDKQMNCWLYAGTMLKSWQIGRKLSVSNVFNYFTAKSKVLNKAYYQRAVGDELGLGLVTPQLDTNGKLVNQFYTDLEVSGFFSGMNFRPLTGVSKPEDWVPALKKYGPLIVFRLNPAHVRLLIGAYEVPDKTDPQMILVDPAFGAERRILMEHYKEEVGSFAKIAGWEHTIWYAPR